MAAAASGETALSSSSDTAHHDVLKRAYPVSSYHAELATHTVGQAIGSSFLALLTQAM
jgi:hypothetical protein